MYINIGQNKFIKDKDIVGIFDLDTSTVSNKTREFLKIKGIQKKIKSVNDDLPKSFLVCVSNKEEEIYICQYSPNTIIKRI